MDTLTDADARTWLRETLTRFAADMTDAEADAMLDRIRWGWGIAADRTLARLVRVVGQLKPAVVLFWLDTTLRVMADPNGRELVFAAGMRVAAACGIAPALLEALRARLAPPTNETSH